MSLFVGPGDNIFGPSHLLSVDGVEGCVRAHSPIISCHNFRGFFLAHICIFISDNLYFGGQVVLIFWFRMSTYICWTAKLSKPDRT